MSLAKLPTTSGTRKTLYGIPNQMGTTVRIEDEGISSQRSHFLDDGYPLESAFMSAVFGIKDQTQAAPRRQTEIQIEREPYFQGEVIIEFEMVIEDLGRGTSLMRFPED